eukprot:6206462-Pleurochrysis_carterae.AAC.1
MERCSKPSQIQGKTWERQHSGTRTKGITGRDGHRVDRKVMGRVELADSPIYQSGSQETGKKVVRDTYKPPEGGDKCERGVARGMLDECNTEEEEDSDIELDIERQEGKREVEKFAHGLRNGEIVGGAARERRMRHATREGNRPSFWTYLKENGCRGCQIQEEEETIQHDCTTKRGM